MINTMLDFNKSYGNTPKTLDSMAKILSMIQKLKKIIAPTRCYEKLIPQNVLE